MDDDEAALLAELRAISAKSSASDRFAGGDDGDDGDGGGGSGDPNEPPPPPAKPSPEVGSGAKPSDGGTSPWKKKKKKKPAARKNKPSGGAGGDLPPWKRKGSFNAPNGGSSSGGVDVEIAAPDPPPPASSDAAAAGGGDDDNRPVPAATAPPSPPLPAQQGGGGGLRSAPSNFQGERGGAAEDADLLAELKAISNKSAGDRFAGGDDDADDDKGSGDGATANGARSSEATTAAAAKPAESEDLDLPPWKRGKPKKKKTASKGSDDAPPWKRKGKKQESIADSFEISVAGAPLPDVDVNPGDGDARADVNARSTGADEAVKAAAGSEDGGFKQSSTFQGERGGAAEDADLLAELRAISNKSADDRFVGGDNDEAAASGASDGGVAGSAPSEISTSAETNDSDLPPWKRGKVKDKAASKKGLGDDVPPWKRKGKKQKSNADGSEVAIAGSSPPAARIKQSEDGADDSPISSDAAREGSDGGGFKQSSTFQGERGGAAEDEDLLAELRAISNKSAGDRFAGGDKDDAAASGAGDDGVEDGAPSEVPALAKADDSNLPPWKRGKAKNKAASEKSSDEVPPWKRTGKKQESNADSFEIAAAGAPPPAAPVMPSEDEGGDAPISSEEAREGSDGGGFNQASTFQGERGGAAEDADLLAALRAISNKSVGDRFAGGDDDDEATTRGADNVEIVEGAPSEVRDSTEGDDSDLPPWKRGKAKKMKAASKGSDVVPPWKRKDKKQESKSDPFEIAVAGSPTSGAGAMSEESSVAVEQAPAEPEGGGFKQASTFQGERGGTAEDADLLAELRAISNKTGGGDRFRGDDDNDDEPNDGASNSGLAEEESSAVADGNPNLPPWKRGKLKKKKVASSKGSGDVPPWKRKGKTPEGATDSFEVAVSADPPPPAAAEELAAGDADAVAAESRVESEEGGFKQASTFQGERGGAAEDADLLAELRAISKKSAGDRFQGEDDDAAGGSEAIDGALDATPTESSSKDSDVPPWKRGKPKKKAVSKKGSGDGVPPWKRKGKTEKDSGADSFEVAVAGSPPPAEPEGGGFKHESTFKGERGGVAEDADLLAELRAISNNTGVDRFAGGDDADDTLAHVASDDGASEAAPKADDSDLPPWKRGKAKKKKPAAASGSKGGDVRPWKRKGKKQENAAADSFDIAVSGPPPLAVESSENDNVPDAPEGGGFKQVSTFTGDRGGAAEDADLLAELRAISNKSGGRESRFQDDDETGADGDGAAPTSSSTPSNAEESQDDLPSWKRGKAKKKKPSSRNNGSGELPPWKRKGEKKDASQGLSDASALSAATSEQEGGFKSSTPSTCKGERGGPAEDADLLAELRAISMGGSRFQESTDEAGAGDDNAPTQPPTFTSNFKSDTPSTFRGERGGAAEDAELLAELRAISGKGGGSKSSDAKDEFAANGKGRDEESRPAPAPAATEAPRRAAPPTNAAPAPAAMPSETPPPAEDPLVTEETLTDALGSKNWKMRKAAYELLASLLTRRAGNEPASGNIDASDIIDSLESSVPAMVKDSNAAALDAALLFALLYADHCRKAASSEHAAKIATMLFKGSGLSSSRPSTAKNSKALVLKLMEVGSDGAASVQSTVEVLLTQGLTSRKPKVVLNSVELILEGARSFGAGSLPLGAVSANAPKMLSHSNAKVREAGMNIIAEICRAAGSKAPLQSVMDTLKKAQMSQLDALLEKQPSASPPKVGLRSKKNAPGGSEESASDVLAALEAGTKEEDMKRFASRPAVDVVAKLPKTDYATKLKLAKWSEKVAAADIVLECGGEKPYKLAQPSPSVNYQPLISDMKKLLEHTHFAVNSKAMAVLSMLAEGVGSSLFPHLRPLLNVLTGLSKDKKLTNAVAKCLDTFFGNILSFDHVLDKDDALPTAVDEKKQKNALARKSSLEFLMRCVERGGEAGPRGALNAKNAERVAKLACQKLKDTDAQPRKVATEILQKLLGDDDDGVSGVAAQVVEGIKSDNPRAYKTLMAKKPGSKGAKGAGSRSSLPPKPSKQRKETRQDMSGDGEPEPKVERRSNAIKSEPTRSRPASRTGSKASGAIAPPRAEEPEDGDIPAYENAIDTLASLSIPNWDAAEDEEGVLAGLKSSNWKLRKAAIESLVAFVDSGETRSLNSAAMLVVVKEHTKSFKESNFNVVKAIMGLFLSLCRVHEELGRSPDYWICKAGVSICVEKIADRKFATVAPPLLTQFCVVRSPATISGVAIKFVEKIKSPLPHEALLKWHQEMTSDFGAAALGNGVKSLIPWTLKECESSNIKVRKAALALIGDLHVQIGPVFKALLFANETSASVKSQIESTISSSPYDPSAAQASREKTCMVRTTPGEGGGGGQESASSGSSGLGLEIPKTDLVASLPPDCLARMGTKEGKNAWKMRKEAMEEVSSGLEKCSGLVSTEPKCFKPLVELVRALRDRLGDSQSNLKPLAARIIGSLLSSVDKVAQAKLGKIAFPALLGCCMSDNKKMMREAALSSLKEGTSLSAMEGGNPNTLSLESYVSSLVTELKDSDFKAVGLPEVLLLLTNNAQFLPEVGTMSSSKSRALEAQFAAAIVACLTSKKSETRAAAEALLKACTEHDAISSDSIRQGAKKLLPAQQRAIGPIISKFQTSSVPQLDKENFSGKSRPGKSSSLRHSSAKSASQSTDSPLTSSRTQGKPSPDRMSSSRNATSSKRALESVKRDLNQDPDDSSAMPDETESEHPLVSSNPNASTKEIRSSSLFRKKENWTDFPEEPSSCMSSLKKSWSFLPASSQEALFPKKGIQKQEDAVAGCELLSRALTVDKKDESSIIIDQLDLVNKWLACSICSREHTVGLQALLSLLLDLFSFLTTHSYQLSDSEATVLLPHLLEKASASKGRFREMYYEALSAVSEGNLYPSNKYGPLCVMVVERSGHAKARALATRECIKCVNTGGLSGMKRGIQITSKALSEESLAENKAALLDLAIAFVTKLNGDVNKYAKVCGNSNLSDKARGLVEERWAKQTKTDAVLPEQENSRLSVGQGRRSMARAANSSGRRSIPSYASSPAFVSKDGNKASKLKRVSSMKAPSMTKKEESPSLSLRLGTAAAKKDNLAGRESIGSMTKDGPFTFSYSKAGASESSSLSNSGSPLRTSGSLSLLHAWERQQQEGSAEKRATTPSSFRPEVITSSLSSNVTEPRRIADSSATKSATGSAASLRARLEHIRSKHKPSATSQVEESTNSGGNDYDLPLPPSRAQYTSPERTDDPGSMLPPVPSRPTLTEEHIVPESLYDVVISALDSLLKRQKPVSDNDQDISRASDALERVHASLSKEQKSDHVYDSIELQELRRGTMASMCEFVDRLMRVLEFSFDCGPSDVSGGISVQLATLAVSTAQQIFVNHDLSHLVSSSDTLALLIRQTVTGLLDSRLATPTDAAPNKWYTDVKRLSKCINKLAIQAAVSSPRHTAFPALMLLQLQCCTANAQDVSGGDADPASLTNRLSRVVAKLCNRVAKTEETANNPYSGGVDIETLLCAMEDTLVASHDTEIEVGKSGAMEPCNTMVRSVMMSALKSKSSAGGATYFRSILKDISIDAHGSMLGKVISSCDVELNGAPSSAQQDGSATSRSSEENHDDITLASLLSDIAKSDDRARSLASLRAFMAENPTVDIHSHLEPLSENFRAYVLEQLKLQDNGAQNRQVTTSSSLKSTGQGREEAARSLPMSERIRSLKSRLNATEAAMQSAVVSSGSAPDPSPSEQVRSISQPRSRAMSQPRSRAISQPRSREAGFVSHSDELTRNKSVSSIRERLAAANSSRSVNRPAPTEESSALGHAAALRARLEAVRAGKQKG